MTTPGFNFSILTLADRQRMADDRIRQYEGDIFSHQMNVTQLNALPDSDSGKTEALNRERTAIDTLVRAVTVAKAERDKMR